MVSTIQRFLRDESGATAIEYGLIAAIVSISIIASIKPLPNKLNAIFNRVNENLT
jgi:pilus assembly protein Flp/PilA